MRSFQINQIGKLVFVGGRNNNASTELAKAHQTVNLLSEVLKAVNLKQFTEVDPEIFEAQNKVAETTKNGALHNIILLGPESIDEAMSKYPEIQAAVFALRNVRGLPWPKDHKKKKDEDILDWIQQTFGFRKYNVENQRGHLILLLAKINKVHKQNPDQQPKVCSFTAYLFICYTEGVNILNYRLMLAGMDHTTLTTKYYITKQAS
ncbi:callose synthase 3-like [Carica papaya]|uniref:callose synthase 3-like n=1 Tax=Carica papaya TaxID=3649 RepID=UPI000B8CD9CA|nr:callose synthase 3-like [Carica papaya]